MEPLNPEDPDTDLVRRVRAIRKAATDTNFDASVVARLRAEFEKLPDEDLENVASMHLLFSCDVEEATMEGCWLSTRIASEVLGKRR